MKTKTRIMRVEDDQEFIEARGALLKLESRERAIAARISEIVDHRTKAQNPSFADAELARLKKERGELGVKKHDIELACFNARTLAERRITEARHPQHPAEPVEGLQRTDDSEYKAAADNYHRLCGERAKLYDEQSELLTRDRARRNAPNAWIDSASAEELIGASAVAVAELEDPRPRLKSVQAELDRLDRLIARQEQICGEMHAAVDRRLREKLLPAQKAVAERHLAAIRELQASSNEVTRFNLRLGALEMGEPLIDFNDARISHFLTPAGVTHVGSASGQTPCEALIANIENWLAAH